jgi:hypothetical protein
MAYCCVQIIRPTLSDTDMITHTRRRGNITGHIDGMWVVRPLLRILRRPFFNNHRCILLFNFMVNVGSR